MAKRRTKAQKYKDLFDAFTCMREGKPVKREGTKDGSIPTHPVVSCPDLPEWRVKKECISWLRRQGVFCNGHDAGTLQNAQGDWGSYGIKGSGDIHGILRNQNGQHFEIECKRGSGGRLSLDQQKRWRDVRGNNGVYLIIHGIQELEYYFKGII